MTLASRLLATGPWAQHPDNLTMRMVLTDEAEVGYNKPTIRFVVQIEIFNSRRSVYQNQELFHVTAEEDKTRQYTAALKSFLNHCQDWLYLSPP